MFRSKVYNIRILRCREVRKQGHLVYIEKRYKLIEHTRDQYMKEYDGDEDPLIIEELTQIDNVLSSFLKIE